jgi:hypothetical protein
MEPTEFCHSVRLTWARHPKWNEICAWTVEHMGLPGHRYITSPDTEFMDWHFRDVRDKLIFITAWGNDGH